MISKSHKYVFIHIYRTGGSSVKSALATIPNQQLAIGPEYSRHVSIQELRKTNSHQLLFNDMFTFGFVRNPWAWLVSIWSFIRQNPHHSDHHKVHKLKDFKQFASWWFERKSPGPILRQYEFLCDEKGKVVVDFVGRYENLQKDFAKISLHIGIKAKLSPINQSTHKDYRTYYDSSTFNTVAHYAQKDIELFGYNYRSLEDLVKP